MDNLLKLAIEAHGGLERWHQFKVVRANISITGAVWHLKGQPDVLKNWPDGPPVETSQNMAALSENKKVSITLYRICY